MHRVTVPVLGFLVGCTPAAPPQTTSPAPSVDVVSSGAPSAPPPAAQTSEPKSEEAAEVAIWAKDHGEMKLAPMHCSVSPYSRGFSPNGEHKQAIGWMIFFSNFPMDYAGQSSTVAPFPRHRLDIIVYGPEGTPRSAMPVTGRFSPDPKEGTRDERSYFGTVELNEVFRQATEDAPEGLATGTGDGYFELTSVKGNHLTGTVALENPQYKASFDFDIDCVTKE